jgi:glycosyltransferase involved in cell wall biosynthesis
VFVLSSEREGLPLVVLEAMASGLPVVATAVGGIPQTIDHGVNGFLVPEVSANAFRVQLQRVLKMPHEQLAQVGRAARQHILASYSTQAMATAYEAVYRDVL